MAGRIVYGLVLFVLVYLYALNSLLCGRLKHTIEGVLAVLCTAMLIVPFFLFGWRTGIGMILFTVVAILIAKALAVPVAHRLLGYRTGYGDVSRNDSERFMAGRSSFEDCVRNMAVQEEKTKRMLAGLASRGGIRNVLAENDIGEDGFLELHRDLMAHGLADLVWDILGDPHKLKQLIALKGRGASWHEYSDVFRDPR